MYLLDFIEVSSRPPSLPDWSIHPPNCGSSVTTQYRTDQWAMEATAVDINSTTLFLKTARIEMDVWEEQNRIEEIIQVPLPYEGTNEHVISLSPPVPT